LGKITLRPEPLDLRDAIRSVAESAAFALQSQALALRLELPDEPLPVAGDVTRLEQCIGNLLNNAIKFTPPGGRVTISGRREGDEVVVVVADEGVGIASEMLDRVFDLFAQADASLARSRGGLGIGLTLVRRLVDLHGGRVTARSAGTGRGSEFVVLALITVIQNNVIGIRHLFRGLWMILKLLHNMLGMRHGDHAIDLYVRVQRGIHQHPLEHRSW